MEQQQQQHIVKVAVRQGGQQQQQQQCLFRTPAPSSFVEQKLEQMYGPGMLCDEASVVLSPTEELQPGIAYFYNVCAAPAATAAGPETFEDACRKFEHRLDELHDMLAPYSRAMQPVKTRHSGFFDRIGHRRGLGQAKKVQ
jgi:hypothetical protein